MMRPPPQIAAVAAAVSLLSAGAADAACRVRAPSVAAAGSGCAAAWMDANLRLNDLLVIGTHNSYKQAIPPAEFAILAAQAPKVAPTLDYAHPALTVELERGARQLELDIVYDPQGGRYASPLLPAVTRTPLDPVYVGAMKQPGFKVMHVPDVDFRSSCPTFLGCLAEIRAWSEAHPRHMPIVILINAKDGEAAAPGGVKPLPFDAAAFAALDAEVRAGLPGRKLITPDEVRGSRATLREGVLAGGWPKLGAARGRILVTLDESPDKVALYAGDRPALQGRALFVNTDERSPAAAYLTLNEPIEQAERIAAAVKAGFLVRTRADADTMEARSGEVKRRDVALAGGSQMVSTDYQRPDPRFTRYSVALPGGAAALCNPLRTGGRCAGLAVEPVR